MVHAETRIKDKQVSEILMDHERRLQHFEGMSLLTLAAVIVGGELIARMIIQKLWK